MQISWSISTEWFFYLIYPFICIFLTKFWRTHLIGVAVLTAVGALSIMAAAFSAVDAIDRFGEGHFGPVAALAHGEQDSFFRWLVLFAPYTRVPEFLLGCLVAAFYRTLQERRPSTRERRAGRNLCYVALMMVIGLHLIMFSPSHPFPFLTFLHLNFGFAVPVALLLFGLTRYETILSRTLSCTWMVACGDASYSIYLLHGLILPNAGLNILPVGQSFSLTSIMVLRMVVSIAVVIGFSLLTYRILECPARRFLRRRLSIPIKQSGSELTPTLVAG
jgi:hypothetical protein